MLKYIIAAIVVAALIAGGIAWRKSDIAHWKQEGRTELANEIAVAKAKADEETKEKQTTRKQKEKEAKYEIKKNLDGDRPVSPVIKRQLERMHKRAN